MTVVSGETSVKEQFSLLRHRLDKLGYKGAFSPESMGLVLKILNDLVQTTESCKKLKSDNDRFMQERKRMESELEPLKQTISQLTKENNMLHVHMITAADSRDERDKKANMAIRKFQNEINDLKFINKQLLSRVEADSRKLEGEKMRMGQILETLGLNLGQEVDAKHLKLHPPSKLINYVPRACLIQEALRTHHSDQFPSALHSADLVKLTEERCAQVIKNAEVNELKVQELTTEIDSLREQIKIREDEISRLGSLLEVERSHNINSTSSAGGDGVSRLVQHSRVDHLENQLEYLNETVATLEKLEKEKALLHTESQEKLTVLTAELKEMYQKNDSLCSDLKHLEKLVGDLNGLQHSTKRNAKVLQPTQNQKKQPPLKPSRVDEIYDKLRKTSAELEEKKSTISKMSSELSTLKQSKSKVDSDLLSAKDEILQLTKRLLDEKPRREETPGGSTHKSAPEDIKQLNNRIKSYENETSNLEKTISEQAKQISCFHADYEQAQHDLELLQDTYEMRCKEVETYETQLAELQKCLDEKSDEYTRLLSLYTQVAEQNHQFRESNVPESHVRESENDLNRSILTADDDNMYHRDHSSKNLSETHLTTSDKVDIQLIEPQPAGPVPGSEEVNDLKRRVLSLENEKEYLEEKLENMVNTHLHEVDTIPPISERQVRIPDTAEYKQLIKTFDEERDSLNHEIDLKTEEIASLRVEILSLRRVFDEKDHLGDEIDSLKQVIDNQGREIRSLQQLLHDARLQNDSMMVELDSSNEKFSTIQSDFAAVVHENRQLTAEVSDLTANLSALQEAAETQKNQLEYLGQVVHAKDDERDQIMASYRRLVQEHSENQRQAQLANEHALKLQHDLSSINNQVAVLNHEIEQKNEYEQTMLKDLREYEQRISESLELARSSADGQSSAVDNMDKELSMMRELLIKAQRSSDDFSGQVAHLNHEVARLRAELEVVRHDNQSLAHELNTEKSKCLKLETLVNEERSRQIQSEIGKRDLMAAKKNAELQLAEINSIQAVKKSSVGQLTAELRKLETENETLKHRLDSVQNALVEQAEQLRVADEDRIRLQMHLSSAKATRMPFHDQSRMEREFNHQVHFETPAPEAADQGKSPLLNTDGPSISSPSLLEQKVMKELSSTKKQLKRYEQLIQDKLHGQPQTIPAAAHSSPSTDSTVPAPNSKVAKGIFEHIYWLIEELLKTWKAQNEAMRREISNLNYGKTHSRTTESIANSPPKEAIARSIKESVELLPREDPFRHSLDESERRRRMLEEENRRLLSVVQQVRDDLRLAKSPQ